MATILEGLLRTHAQLEVFIEGESPCVRPAPWHYRQVLGYDSKSLRQGSRSQWRRRRRAAFGWLVAAVFIVAAVVGLIYLIYEGQAR